MTDEPPLEFLETHSYNQRRLWFINLKQAILCSILNSKENAVKCKSPSPPGLQLRGFPSRGNRFFDNVWAVDNFSGC